MKKPCVLLIVLLLISCQEKGWKTNLLNEISEYENSENIEKEYSIEHNSGNNILIKLYRTHSNGLTKLIADYKRPDLGDWEKLFFLKNDKVLYSINFGIAPVQNLKNDSINRPKYFLVERNVWFEKDSVGKEERKEIELFDLKNVESKKAELLKMEFTTSDLNINDYKLFESDYKALTE